jgi:hypothetical protein
LIDDIYRAVISIDAGRKGLATKGKEPEGRVSFEDGIAQAMSAFIEAHASADPQILFLAEYTFISQELEFCPKSATDTINSLNKAVEAFDDAFLALEAVEEPGYKTVDKALPHNKDYRVDGLPRDSVHAACRGHQARLKNNLKTPGLNPVETALLKQRLSNIATAQSSYMEKQRQALNQQ